MRFARINDAILWLFDGIAMTRSGKVINESAFTLLERSPDLTAMTGTQHRRLRTVFDRRTLQDAEVIDDPVILPTNGWNRAFGHWIDDTLTAINTFIEPIRSGRLRVVMPEATAWQRSWLWICENTACDCPLKPIYSERPLSRPPHRCSDRGAPPPWPKPWACLPLP